MNFVSPKRSVMLLTDHISINTVTSILTKEYITKKVKSTLKELIEIWDLKDIYFSGIDPHCGEKGLISSHDDIIEETCKVLQVSFPKLRIHGPIPADTLHLKFKDNQNQLFIYAYHDQALAPFKLENGLVGINLSLGLPFRRVSVDHGTAFDLYGKNKANYQGMLYLMQEIINWK